MDEKPKGPKKDRPDRGFRPNVEFGAKRPGAKSFMMTPEGVFIQKDGKLETLADAVDMFWSEVALEPASWTKYQKGYRWLVDNAGKSDREDLRRALNWVELCLQKRDRDALAAAARYIVAMPDQLLAGDYGRLITIFNSRKVGMVWQVTPDLDLKPLPPAIPKFGREAGFGLIRSVPELYLKLSMYGIEMEEVVRRLAAEALQYGVSLPAELAAMAAPPAAKG